MEYVGVFSFLVGGVNVFGEFESGVVGLFRLVGREFWDFFSGVIDFYYWKFYKEVFE